MRPSHGYADLADDWPGEDHWSGSGLGEVLRDALDRDYADASPEDLDDALSSVLESMSPAESFNFASALKQIERGAGQVLADPTVSQIARVALPIAGGVVGTAIGGPLGTGIGSSLGTAAANALGPTAGPAPATVRPVASPAPVAPTAAVTPRAAGGSAAAAQGLVLTQQPDVLNGLLSLAMGQHGKNSVNGVPVAALMGMLSSVFGQAAADADELMYLDGDAEASDGEAWAELCGGTHGRALYTTLLDADNYDLAEALDDRY